MSYLVVLVAFFASGMSFFSGFGLGTLLLPIFALFFPIQVAIAFTAIVHLMNNLFKGALLVKQADFKVVMRFGFFAILGSFLGAYGLVFLSRFEPLFYYEWGGHLFAITVVKWVIALLMILFACFEIMPVLKDFSFHQKYLPWGGFLSGFFGGISGHQGALRSAFLVRCGLSKEAFLATGVTLACLVDIPRLVVYRTYLPLLFTAGNGMAPWLAILGAMAGSLLGMCYLKKMTIRRIQIIVSAMLFLIAIALGVGVI